MQTEQNPKQLAVRGSKLCDALIAHHQLKNDAALSRLYEVAPPVISKMRTGKLPVGDSFVIRALRLNPDWSLAKVESLFHTPI